MTDEKRKYRKRARAEHEAETRRRITESAVELHGTLGPSQTSISAVAERAGVRRSTVYRHFPDEEALFAACSSRWEAANPLPDLAGWARIADPDERLAIALLDLYAYYRGAASMVENLLRDEATMPTVRRRFRGYRDYLVAARGALASGRGLRGARRRATLAAIGHAVSFPTWRSLTREQGLDDPQAADLMVRFIAAAAARSEL